MIKETINENLQASDHVTLKLEKSEVDLAFISEGQYVFLISSDSDSRWPSHLLRSGTTSLKIGDREFAGYASLITSDKEKSQVEANFRKKYGDTYFNRYFRHPGRYLKIDISGKSEPRQKSYFEWLEEEFDSEAGNYDEHIFGNRINRLLRERSLETIFQYVKPPSQVLEIGCGSGTETMEVLKSGCSVVAVDISGGMIRKVKEKAESAGLNHNLSTFKLRASQISEILKIYGPESFDLIYSTFGALNCDAEIEKIPPILEYLLRKGGHFIAGVYNKFCISELLINLTLLHFDRLSWRLRNPIPEGHSRFCIDVYSFSPGEFNSMFKGHFKLVGSLGVPVLIPPSNFKRFIGLTGKRFEKMNSMDRKLSGLWPWKYLGDHFISVFEKD
ncbi:MAG: methyltransferase domain-containing protein [Candidatus Thermoplasmatota archaeon]|nr:methyltransferase domain-containing protein [Candidatus Thermoplasmatota archaeon]